MSRAAGTRRFSSCHWYHGKLQIPIVKLLRPGFDLAGRDSGLEDDIAQEPT